MINLPAPPIEAWRINGGEWCRGGVSEDGMSLKVDVRWKAGDVLEMAWVGSDLVTCATYTLPEYEEGDVIAWDQADIKASDL